MSNSVTESKVLAGQLNAFAEAQRLRERCQMLEGENAKLVEEAAILIDRNIKLESLTAKVKSEGIVKHLPCVNCGSPVAPADTFEDGEWRWELDKAYECEDCGTNQKVFGDEFSCSLEEIVDDYPEDEDCEEENEEL